ncbi:MAG: ABC transporter permease subunit [Candidatus Hydrogenedens sp.]|nr:ABC transporter permease subunit [Candidatus Hydrogenedens sp.]
MSRTPQRRLRAVDYFALALCLPPLLAFVLYPTLRLAAEALGDWRWDAFTGGTGLQAVVNTLLICLGSVAGAGVFGTALAFAVARFRFPGRNLLAALALLPFTLPPLVGVLGFYYLIGRDGVITRLLERAGFENAALPGPWAILLIHTYSFYVFFYAMVSAALAQFDQSQIEAARTLGASRLRVLFRVTLPLLRPALAGAALLTFMSSAASFSAPYYFGGDFPMLSTAVYYANERFDMPEALTLTVVLAVVALMGVVLFRTAPRAGGSGTKGAPRLISSAAGKVATGAAAWTLMVLLLLPHLIIAWFAFADHRAWHTEILPTTFTLDNFAELFRSSSAFQPILNSLWASALATVATIAVALPASYLIGRGRPGRWGVNLLVMIPWALPGTVIALNLIVAFNDDWLPLFNTIWLLPLAYFVRNVPLLTRMSSAAVEAFDTGLLEAAATLGAGKRHAFLRVTLPLLAPALATAVALVFAMSLGEFVASILVYVPGNLPISVRIDMAWRDQVGVAFAYSVLLMLLVGATFVVARRFSARSV